MCPHKRDLSLPNKGEGDGTWLSAPVPSASAPQNTAPFCGLQYSLVCRSLKGTWQCRSLVYYLSPLSSPKLYETEHRSNIPTSIHSGFAAQQILNQELKEGGEGGEGEGGREAGEEGGRNLRLCPMTLPAPPTPYGLLGQGPCGSLCGTLQPAPQRATSSINTCWLGHVLSVHWISSRLKLIL